MSAPSLLGHRDFRLLLLGQTTSQLGSQISGVAIPLLAVLTLDATPIELGLVTGSATLAFALIGLPAGAWLDRCRRRWILVTSDVSRAALLATIPVAALCDVLTIGQLVVVSLLNGLARVFFDVGYRSYLPSVIGRGQVLAGNSAMETLRSGGQIAGPGIGGWLVSVTGAANVILVQAAAFVVSALSLLAIRTPEPPPVPAPQRRRLAAQIAEGLRFVARTRVLRAMAITSAASNFSFAVASAVAFIFMARTLSLSATAIGLIVAAGSVTVLVGAAATPALSRRLGSARIIWLSLVATGPITLLGPFAEPGALVALLVISAAAGEAGQIVYSIASVSLRQRLCPDRMLGRVNATMQFLIMGLFPVGALLGGLLGELIGLRATLWLAASIATLAPLPLFLALRSALTVEDIAGWHDEPGEPATAVRR